MILRRITNAFKRQDWFTVFIETMIVVLGVFMGLQVQNWNEARIDHIAAIDYHQRLLGDMGLEAINYDYLLAYYRDVETAAERAYAGFSGETDLGDADLLVNAFRASQYNWMERQRATYDELVGSGHLDLIQDTKLRTLVTGYYSTTFLEEIAQDNKNSEYRRAFRMAVAPDLQEALSEQCGDRQVEGAQKGIYTLHYDCTLDWPPEKITAALATLRSDPDLLSLLRLRIANLGARNFALDSNYGVYDLDSFKKQEARK